MRKFYSAFRLFVHIVIISVIAIYTLSYILLSVPGIQDRARRIGIEELSALLGTRVEIDRIQFSPFNKLELFGVYLPDQQGDTLVYANKLSAGIALGDLVFNKELIFTNIQLFGLDARISQARPDTVTNLQFVIDAFKSKSDKPKEKIKFKINNAIIRRGKIRYDLLSAPPAEPGRFDPNHIGVKNLLSKLSIKSLTDDSVNVSIKRLSFDERSGFSLNRLQFKLEGNRRQATLSDFKVQLPSSHIEIKPIVATLPDTLSTRKILDETRLSLQIPQARIALGDLAPFAPLLDEIETSVDLSLHLSGTPNDFYVHAFDFDFGHGSITAHSQIAVKQIADARQRSIVCDPITLHASAEGLADILQKIPSLTDQQRHTIARLGNVHFSGDIANRGRDLTACGTLTTDLGTIHSDLSAKQNGQAGTMHYAGLVESQKFNLNGLFAEGNPYGEIVFKVELDSRKTRHQAPTGKVVGTVNYFEYKGYPYENIALNGEFGDNRYNGVARIDDTNGHVEVKGLAVLKQQESEFDLTLQARDIHVAELRLMPSFEGSKLGFNVTAQFTGNSLDNAEGAVTIDSLTFTTPNDRFTLNRFSLEAHNRHTPQSIAITSDYLNGCIEGQYRFSTLKESLQRLVAQTLPSLMPQPEEPKPHSRRKNTKKKKAEEPAPLNNFKFRFTIEPTLHMSQIFALPVTFTDRATLEGELNSSRNTATVTGQIPHLWYKKRHIEDAYISARKDTADMYLSVETSTYNKKQVRTIWSLRSKARHDNLDVVLNWNNDTQSTFYGEVNTSTAFSRTADEGALLMHTHINPSTLIFNDTIWQMKPADLTVADKRVEVHNFEISHAPQYILIDGVASDQENDLLNIQLNDVDLDYIFGTLNIKHVSFGGNATGNLVASHLFTPAPRLSTEQFDVRNFAYNGAVFGDLHLFSMWDNDNQGILMKGFVENPEEKQTYIDGYIFPTRDSLALSFDPDRLNIAFLQPFVETVMTDVSGVASGHIDFYGNFKALNVTGDAYVENFNFGIGYLNTRYTLTDSIHFSPTRIWFDNVTVYDKLRHTAKGSGWLSHHNFKDLAYDIAITDARDFLSYDMTERQSPTYYGTIYGTGSALIKGEPGYNRIDVNMATGDQSNFTFVLSGSEAAGEYDFITFTNSARSMAEADESQVDSTAILNNARMMESNQAQENSILALNLQIEATNQAKMNLVMDKSTGDMIKATGRGSILLEYNSMDDDIKLYGSYVLEKGSYNFSLQDIITRDFSIKEGSRVSFHGDPMATNLDISAIYSLTANLLDLDENFANDKELTRTTVPVQTILNVAGDVRRPDLSFDIAFPTLTQDMDRRVRSIISTNDMMNRQIIYLLALNRFYTPDFMNMGQSRNNELVSVASSTLSSQLGNILGQLSDNWNISPNFRSEKGDFSDMEVDLALSSQLLNNRLIFNGNFGYRDNTINNNTFIGDFDLEYLLNKSGTIRLKAYNHYNDQNYYIKSALTTQGVGIMLRHDFSLWSDLFKRSPRPEAAVDSVRTTPPSTQPETPADSTRTVRPETPTLPADSTRVVSRQPALKPDEPKEK